jgi:CRP-like cAMP-binding protein
MRLRATISLRPMSVDPELLAELPLFSSLKPEQLELAAGWTDERRVSPGERVCGEGASGYSFFVIREGAVAVTQDGQELRRLGPGEFFGELAMLGAGRRSATVTAVEPSTLVVLFGTEFRRLEAELPEVAARIRLAVEQRAQAS